MKSPFTIGYHIRSGMYSVHYCDHRIAEFLCLEKAEAFAKLMQEVMSFNPSNENVKTLIRNEQNDPFPFTPTPIG